MYQTWKRKHPIQMVGRRGIWLGDLSGWLPEEEEGAIVINFSCNGVQTAWIRVCRLNFINGSFALEIHHGCGTLTESRKNETDSGMLRENYKRSNCTYSFFFFYTPKSSLNFGRLETVKVTSVSVLETHVRFTETIRRPEEEIEKF